VHTTESLGEVFDNFRGRHASMANDPVEFAERTWRPTSPLPDKPECPTSCRAATCSPDDDAQTFDSTSA
jgi:hypothetical protein